MAAGFNPLAPFFSPKHILGKKGEEESLSLSPELGHLRPTKPYSAVNRSSRATPACAECVCVPFSESVFAPAAAERRRGPERREKRERRYGKFAICWSASSARRAGIRVELAEKERCKGGQWGAKRRREKRGGCAKKIRKRFFPCPLSAAQLAGDGKRTWLRCVFSGVFPPFYLILVQTSRLSAKKNER